MPSVNPTASSAALPLRDIHLPPAPAWWPPAPGWWLLVAVLLLVALGLVLLSRRSRRLRFRREALQKLAVLEKDLQLPPAKLLAELSTLLRRAMLCSFERKECAGLTGDNWLNFLDRGFKDSPFSSELGRCLAKGPYQPGCDYDRDALLALCRRRLKKLPAAPKQRRRS